MKYYLVGIKGTGMSSLACILKDMGNVVTGSDVKEHFFTEKSLDEKNITYEEFTDEVTNEYFYVISSAYDINNIVVKKIINENYNYMYYHEFIEFFFKKKKIGICGSHGKTTTTKVIAKVLEDKNICYLSGDSSGKGTKNYEYFVLEACEYKNHFLSYTYDYLIMTNIDYDHPDYFKNKDDYLQAFQEVSKKTKCLIANGDDENIKRIKHKNKITYGFNYDNDYVIYSINKYKNGYFISIVNREKEEKLYIPLFGKHNILNVVASYVLVDLLKIDVQFQKKIYEFKLPKRRMEEVKYKSNILICDYAHHPTEIKALIEAILEKYEKEIIIIFQPHTYSRTLALKEDFRKCFEKAKKLYIMNTFISREQYDQNKEREVKKVFSFFDDYDEKVYLSLKKETNKVILFLGAGTVDKEMEKLYNNL